MLDICICEDDLAIRQRMASLVSDYCLWSELDANLVLVSESPKVVLDFFKGAVNPVLFFLDIDLGADMDGLELAAKIREINKEAFIVFFTTKSELAPMTFRYQLEALDFIVKDGDQEEIKSRIRSSIETAVTRSVKSGSGRVFSFKHDDKVVQIPIADILYIETTGTRYKLNLHTESRRLSINGELKKFEAELGEGFVRCHQSCLVNVGQIAEIAGSELMLSDGSVVPLSRGGRKLVMG